MASVQSIYGSMIDRTFKETPKVTADQTKQMKEVADKITTSISLKVTVAELVQSFLDFVERGKRAPRDLVERVGTAIELHSSLPEPECDEVLTWYLNLSGYSRDGKEI